MKKIYTLFFAFLITLSFISEKSNAQNNVLLEYFTGTWCQYCPCGHSNIEGILANYPNSLSQIFEGSYALHSAAENEIDNKEIIGEAALFMSDLWHEIGEPEKANRYKEIALNQKSIAKSHSIQSVRFKDLPSKQQNELIIPLIGLMHDKSKNFGNDYLYSHPELLHEDVVSWALSLADGKYNSYKRTNDQDFLREVLNLSMIAFSISVEIHDNQSVLSACDNLSRALHDFGKHSDARYWEKMANQFRER